MTFDYRTQNYFPKYIFIGGYLVILLGITLLFVNWVGALVVLLIGVFIITTKYGISIDLDNSLYQDYLSVFGVKTGNKNKFDKVEKLFLTSGNKTTTMQLRAVSNDITELEYNGYIKFSDDDKVHLVSSTKKEEVIILLQKMSLDLSVVIDDLCDELNSGSNLQEKEQRNSNLPSPLLAGK